MNPSASDPNLVGQIVAEWRERLLRGESFQIEEYTARYPRVADELRELFPAVAMIEDLKGDMGNLTGSVAAVAVRAGGATLERLGDYRILREIGRGGMGIVYEAEQESLGRRVALKVLPGGPALDPQQQKRFQREARAAARMHHTNIVPVYGVGEHEGMLYYVMQFIQGLGLDDVLAELRRMHEAGSKPGTTHDPETAPTCTRDLSAADVAQSLLTGQFSRPGPAAGNGASSSSNGQAGGAHTDNPASDPPLPLTSPDAERLVQTIGPPPSKPREGTASGATLSLSGHGDKSTLTDSGRHYWLSVARIGVQVGEALDYAHTQGVLHRDIKPSNLLLDTQGTVWVTDFGLAKAAADGDNLTHTGDIVGTLRYMAPERFNGVSDARGDIYSLGLTLYELLCQRPAFEETDRNKLIKRVMDGSPMQPRKVNPTVPRDLETIVLKAIDREPDRRYATARALSDDLKRFLDDKPIQARQISPTERLWRWCRRNPALASLSGAMLTLLVVVAVASTLVAFRFQHMAQEEGQLRVRESHLREVADDARARAETARAEAEASLREAERQKDLAQTNLREAERQKKLAEANFQQARLAVDASLTRISESKLLNIPGLQPLRKELLDSALRYYQGFLKQHADNPDLQKDLATAYALVARITAEIGSRDEALKAYEQALKIRTRLVQGAPGDLQQQAEIAAHHQAVGRLLQQTGELPAALKSLQESAGILRAIIPQSKDKLDLLHAFASVHNDLGVVYVRKNEPLEAMSYYTAALKLQRQLVEENRQHPRIAALRYDLASQLTRMGRLQGDLGLSTEAMRLHREALAILKDLVAAHPGHEQLNDWQRALAGSHESIGDVQNQSGQPAAALASYQEALPIRERLAGANPAVTDYQGDLAHTYFTLGQFQLRAGQTAAAVESYRRAIDGQRLVVAASSPAADPARVLARQFARLGEAQRKLNQPADALRSYQEARALLEKLPPTAPADLYELACARAACSLLSGNGKAELTAQEKEQQQKDAAQALDALRKAVAADFRDIERLRRDTELEGLRSHPTFKELLAEVEKKVKVLHWHTDFEAARALAAREKKDLFVYFTGSDWCPWCLLVRREVFGKDAFIDNAAKHFVMVELDFPRYKAKPKNYAQNSELLRRWGLKGFPSLILADARGRAYANLRDGQVRDTAEAYVGLMDKLRQNHLARDEFLTRALAEEGVEKAKLLDQALNLLPRDFIQADYGDAVGQILELDPLDKAGLRSKYLPLAIGQRRIDVQEALKKQDWDGTILKIDKVIEELKPTGKVAVDLLIDRAKAHVALKQWDKAAADYDRALELRPDDPVLRIERGEFFEKRKQPEKAIAEFSAAVEGRAREVETSRSAFARAPHVLNNRRALSSAFAALAGVQRRAGRPADAAATTLERARLWPGNFGELYNAACELARCVPVAERGKEAGQPYADQAMDLLRRAVLAGMSDAAHIKADADLAPLRQREDFKQLLGPFSARGKFPAAAEEGRALSGHSRPLIEAVAYSPDSRRVLSSGYDNTVRLWDADTAKEIRQFSGHRGLVHGLAFSADGRRIVTAGNDGTVRVWDADTGKEAARLTGHEGPVQGVALLPDGKQVLSCSRDKTVRLWDVAAGKEVRQLSGHTGPVLAVALTRDGRRAISGGADATVRYWDVSTGKEIRRLDVPQSPVLALALSADGRRALAGTSSGLVYLWELESGQLLRRLEGHWGAVRAVGFTPDGRRLLSANVQGGLVLSDAESGAELFRFAPGLACGSLAVAPDGRHVATANNDSKVHLWALAEDTLRARKHAMIGEADKAAAAYDELLRQRPEEVELWIERARFHARQQKWDRAIADYTRALEKRADDRDLWTERGRCHADKAEWDKVAADFTRVFTLLPDDASSTAARRALGDELARWEKAFDIVLAARPKDAHLWFARGRQQARLARWTDAAAAHAKGMELQAPDNAEFWFEHASLRLLAGDGDGYRRACAELLERYDKKGGSVLRPFLVARACTLAPNAVADGKRPAKVAEQEPATSRSTYWSLTQQGALSYRAGRFEHASAKVQECRGTYPNWEGNVINTLYLAMAQYQLGQKEEARKTLAGAQQWFDRHGNVMPQVEGPFSFHLHDWLEAHILRREAESLIRGLVGVRRQ